MDRRSIGQILKDLLQDEERDELGFTLSDYYDMQKLKDLEGKSNVSSGFDISSEQIALINNVLHPFHSVAVMCFYDVNFKLLRRMAYCYLACNLCFKAVVSYEDLVQQLYVDMLSGALKLPYDTTKIKSVVYACYRFAAVGGLEVLKNAVS